MTRYMLSPGMISIKDFWECELKKALYGPTNEAVKINVKKTIRIRNIYLYNIKNEIPFYNGISLNIILNKNCDWIQFLITSYELELI